MHCCSGYSCIWRLLLAMLLTLMVTSALRACPFCTVESRTLTEEIESSTAVVLAKLVADAPKITAQNEEDPNAGMATFEVIDVLRGDDRVKPGEKIRVVYFGEGEQDRTFFVSGIGVEDNKLEWTTPLPLGPKAVDYVRKLQTVPTSGADRLAFFQEYFESEDPLLGQDSYDEFARAPYADLVALKDRMPHDKLVAWINSPDVNPSRRRLYLTMLGVCGGEADLPMLEAMITSDFSKVQPAAAQLAACGLAFRGPVALPMWIEMLSLDERRKKLGLDAMIGAYLMLRGDKGLELINKRFLLNPDAEYAHIYSTIMALRTLGEETDAMHRAHLTESLRLMLDNADFADQVIPDLARWEDWSVLDRLVGMYKAGDERSYVRQPIVTYLTVASEQTGEVGERAKAALAELTELDPEGVKRAQSLMAFGFLARARGTDTVTGAKRPDDDEKAKTDATTEAARGEFAATPEEMADAENAEPDDFADPAGFAETDSVRPDEMADDTEEVEVDEAEEVEQPAATEPIADTPAVADHYSRPLVIGVPLVAVGLLTVVYWLILRWGAV